MTLLLSLLTPSAHAEPAADMAATCAPAWVERLTPDDGASDVPVDARLTALMRDGGCGGVGGVLRLEDELGVVLEVFEPEVEAVAGGALLHVTPDPPLEPETDYVLTFEAMGDVPVVSMFRTGSSVAADPDAASPEIVSIDGWWSDRQVYAGVEVAVEATPGALVHLVADRDDVPTVVFADDLGVAGAYLELRVGEDVEEVCVLAAQQSESGALSDWSEACAPFEAPERTFWERTTGGCSTTPGAASALLGLLALPLIRRRR